jgi:hypothetical protein
VSRAAGLVAGLLAAAAVASWLGAGAGGAHAAAVGGSREPARRQEAVDRTVQDRQIAEISGMVASVRHPGSVWVHEDSGRPAVLYAINRGGGTQAALTVRGAKAFDWEAMATARDSTGRRVLVIGDIGDNGAVRQEIEILVLREPARLRDATVTPVRRIRLRYPDEAADAEALLADPRTGRLYIVTKSIVTAELFAVPQAAWPGAGPDSRVWTLEPVARLETSVVTDGAFLPDGQMLLRNYGSMSVFPAPETATGPSVRSLASASLPDQQQGEAIAVTTDGRSALLGSEGNRQPILRVTVPVSTIAQDSATATPTRVGARSADTSQAVEDQSEEEQALPSLLIQVMLIALGVLMLIFTVVVLALR